MHTRFGRIVIAWALVLLTVWLDERLYRSDVSVVDEPKLITPGGTLSDWEKSNIELFRVAGAAVAYLTTEQVRFNPLRGASVAQGAGAGFIWDKAGHVVTNFHVIEGADTVDEIVRGDTECECTDAWPSTRMSKACPSGKRKYGNAASK
jgi:2-alkenal reductase